MSCIFSHARPTSCCQAQGFAQNTGNMPLKLPRTLRPPLHSGGRCHRCARRRSSTLFCHRMMLQPSPDKPEQAAGGNARTASLQVRRVRKDCTGGVGHVVHASKVGVYLRSIERTLTGIVIASTLTGKKNITAL